VRSRSAGNSWDAVNKKRGAANFSHRVSEVQENYMSSVERSVVRVGSDNPAIDTFLYINNRYKDLPTLCKESISRFAKEFEDLLGREDFTVDFGVGPVIFFYDLRFKVQFDLEGYIYVSFEMKSMLAVDILKTVIPALTKEGKGIPVKIP